MKDELGQRMKDYYEGRSRHYLLRRTPVIIRLDGKAFHTFTRSCEKPFDLNLIECMNAAALEVAKGIQGCVAFYHQSDEVSFLIRDYQQLESQAWFDYNQSKLESISASLMTGHFNNLFKSGNSLAFFDSRAFNIPKEEVVNAFLWRIMDYKRNSVAMVAQDNFSPKQLHGKNVSNQKEMLLEKGIDWEEYPHFLKYGSLWVRESSRNFEKVFFEPTYENLESCFDDFLN